jgi:hypothetical protein
VKVAARSAAQRWGEARERELLVRGPALERKDIRTLEAFAPRFIDGHARANRQKPGGMRTRSSCCAFISSPILGRSG